VKADSALQILLRELRIGPRTPGEEEGMGSARRGYRGKEERERGITGRWDRGGKLGKERGREKNFKSS